MANRMCRGANTQQTRHSASHGIYRGGGGGGCVQKYNSPILIFCFFCWGAGGDLSPLKVYLVGSTTERVREPPGQSCVQRQVCFR